MHGTGYSVTTCLHRQVTTAGSPGGRWTEDLMGGTGETWRLMTKRDNEVGPGESSEAGVDLGGVDMGTHRG